MIRKETLQFLDDLKNNNHKEWFHDQKKRYDDYKNNYHTVIEFLLKNLKPFDAKLEPLEVKHCTFIINRDIRFSKDKSPYKTHMAIWLSQNRMMKNAPGYYLHISPEETFVAGGLWCPEAPELQKIRKEIAFFHEDLEQIIQDKKFHAYFSDLDRPENQVLKTAPKGYEKDHPALHWLQLKSFTASYPLSTQDITKQDTLDQVVEIMKVLKPLNDFIYRAIETED
ncbi:MAG: DUF2461 domain-containing protein [Flavobacterium sp.]